MDGSQMEEERSLCNGLTGSYSFGLHVGAIFLVLFASLFGCSLPLITKYVKSLRENPFVFVVGKTAATGVLLSVSCIHLIHESGEAFREPCILPAFQNYSAYDFFFALIAALLMHGLDIELATISERWLKSKNSSEDVTIVSSPTEDNNSHANSDGLHVREGVKTNSERDSKDNNGVEGAIDDHDECHPSSHGHQHSIALPPAEMGQIHRVISAICMEFGVTLHSVFVGIAVGLTTNSELKPLMVALFFHQLFEGMALGSRLVDAKFNGSLEYILALIFCISAPFGMIVSTIAVSISRDLMSGGNFVTVLAILNSFCGGILLYLAFTLLIHDFTDDMKQYGSQGKDSGKKKLILYAALWIGMLLMAFVGKWL